MQLGKLLVCLGVASATSASAATYDCEMKDGSDGGAIPPRIILAVDPEKEVGSAFDGYIKSVHGAPIPVEYVRESEKRHTLRWTLVGLRGANNASHVISYTARVYPATLKVTLTGRLHGFDNEIKGYGTCKVAE